MKKVNAPVVFLDKELTFLNDNIALGVNSFKSGLDNVFVPFRPKYVLHDSLIGKLEAASKSFNVIIIKTDFVIPYTSVFFQLECAYWSESSENKLRKLMNK